MHWHIRDIVPPLPPPCHPQKRAPRRERDSGGFEPAFDDDMHAEAALPAAAAAMFAAPPPVQRAAPQRPQRRFAGYNVRRGGGMMTPRTSIATPAGVPRRQQPWQMLLPAGVPPAPLTAEMCRNQVMADLIYLFK